MRILIVHNALMDSRSVSGVVKLLAQFADVWIEAGHQVDFLAARAGFPRLRELCPRAGLVSSDSIFDATRHLDRTWTYFPAYAWRCLTAYFTRLPRRPDLVYASGQFIVEIHCARVLARRHGVPWLVKVHHMLCSQQKRMGLIDRLFLGAEILSTRLINREAHRVLCVSPPVAADYQAAEAAQSLPPSLVHVTPNGLDLAPLLAAPSRAKRHDCVLLCRMHEQKGIFDLPRFWSRVRQQRPDARLLLIGEGPHRAACEAALSRAGHGGSYRFTGAVDEAEKNALLAESRIGLSLSYEEGWGLSVMEYLAFALPVAAYRLPVFETVFPDQFRMAPLGDPEALAGVVVELLNRPDAMKQQGLNGRDFVQRYDHRKVALEELRILETVANQSRFTASQPYG
jgi:glycosyltransferase involved in cell wall biosynthesis